MPPLRGSGPVTAWAIIKCPYGQGDYVGMDNAFFQLIQNLGWAAGDINSDGVINFDDYSKVDQAFFFQHGQL